MASLFQFCCLFHHGRPRVQDARAALDARPAYALCSVARVFACEVAVPVPLFSSDAQVFGALGGVGGQHVTGPELQRN